MPAVSGAHDLPDFRRMAALMPTLMPNARHIELPWAGRLPGLERPAEVAALLTFLAGESADAAAPDGYGSGPGGPGPPGAPRRGGCAEPPSPT
ncbi:alpha/beta fold hydrolase [Streptomyces sp. NPDC015127]|uniref:alpha/beta fold hydrolase n=1 Tax=Streptomyces sp. NPDC015127 TaxID=3364939 RepID=UPI0036FF358C